MSLDQCADLEDWAISQGLDPTAATTRIAYAQSVRFGRPCTFCGHDLRPSPESPTGWGHIDADGNHCYRPHTPIPVAS